MLIQLPNGVVEGPDHFNLAEIDELRGKQQNYLADKDLVVGNLGHIPKILEDMILSLQTKEGVKWQGKMIDAINKLPSGDIETLLVKIRENTYGPRFYHEADCPHCGKKLKNLRLDLDKLDIKNLPHSDLIKKHILSLPKSSLEAELKPIYLKDIFEAVKMMNKKSNSIITSAISMSLKRLGDKSPVLSKDVENIPASDILFLNKSLEEITLEGSIDTNIELTCDNEECKKDFSIKLNCFDPSFFDPTRGSMNTTT